MLAFSFPVITVYKVGIKLLNPLGRAELLFVLYHVLKFLSRNFQGCCLLFNYQGSLFCCVSATQLNYNITCIPECQYLFLTFFDIFFGIIFYILYRNTRILFTVITALNFHKQLSQQTEKEGFEPSRRY